MASRSMPQPDHGVTIGVDTHGDAHVAAAFTSDLGRPLGHLTIATTPAGYSRGCWTGPAVSAATHASASKAPDRTVLALLGF